jgi:hypothetical protein
MTTLTDVLTYFQASVTTLTDVFPAQQGKAYNFGF